MTATDKPVLVFGGTGRQGGAVARELLRRGRPVRALVRDPDSPAARALADAGAHLVRGDFDDPASVQAAMRGVAGVFSVHTFRAPGGVEAEYHHGATVADAAARAGVAHLVYSSVGGADRATGIPHFDSKARIEARIHALGLPATVLRPTFFMDNFTRLTPRHQGGALVLRLALQPHVPLQLIACADIGTIATEALLDPSSYLGRQLEIAGDELTGPQIANVFTRLGGVPVRFEQQPIDELREHNPDSAAMFTWFNSAGYQADLTTLRRSYPHLMTLESWLRRTGWTPPH